MNAVRMDWLDLETGDHTTRTPIAIAARSDAAERAAEAIGHEAAARAVEALYAVGHWLLSEWRARDAAVVFRAMALAAPCDERAWLGLGIAHERAAQPSLALEMYGVGRTLAHPSVRCEVARARLMIELGRDAEADAAFDAAEAALPDEADEAHAPLAALVANGRRL